MKLLIYLLLLFSLHASAQKNLVVNGDFEEFRMFDNVVDFTNLPDSNLVHIRDTSLFWDIANKNEWPMICPGWQYIDSIDTRSYNCSYSDSGRARSGKRFGQVLMYFVYPSGEAKIDNLVGEFSEPLTEGMVYEVSIYIKPNRGNLICSGLGVSFIQNPRETIINWMEPKGRIKASKEPKFQVDFEDKIQYLSIDTFTLVRFEYRAKGGENFIYIGNHYGSIPPDCVNHDSFGHMYEYQVWERPFLLMAIDDVSVIELPINSKTHSE